MPRYGTPRNSKDVLPEIHSTSGRICSPRGKRSRLAAGARVQFRGRHVLRARTCVPQAACRCARTRYSTEVRVSGCIVPACDTTAGVPLLRHYGRSGSSENGRRGRAEGISRFVTLKNHAGGTRAGESPFAKSNEFANRRKGNSNGRANRLILWKIRWRVKWVAREVKIITLSGK